MPCDQFLFVYGTLRRTVGGVMHERLLRRSQFVRCATFQGRLYLVADYPGAVSSSHPSDVVHGEVYRLLDPQPLWSELDQYEGSVGETPEQKEYVRGIHQVVLRGGDSLSAWVYVYNRSIQGLPRLESGDFSEFQI